jgi:4-hydroxy-tetrahydrodipicolinate reductase
VWAAGSLDAAEWLVERNPGYYGFADVLDGEGQ